METPAGVLRSTNAASVGASFAGFRDAVLFGPARVRHVCQFNNPGAVVVHAAHETVNYEARPGTWLTITVQDGRPSCVVGGWFNLR